MHSPDTSVTEPTGHPGPSQPLSGHLIELFTQLRVFKQPEQLGRGVGSEKHQRGLRPCCWKI